MPTILLIQGWRFFFYRNEGNEPMHIHGRKGDAECKYWINARSVWDRGSLVVQSDSAAAARSEEDHF